MERIIAISAIIVWGAVDHNGHLVRMPYPSEFDNHPRPKRATDEAARKATNNINLVVSIPPFTPHPRPWAASLTPTSSSCTRHSVPAAARSLLARPYRATNNAEPVIGVLPRRVPEEARTWFACGAEGVGIGEILRVTPSGQAHIKLFLNSRSTRKVSRRAPRPGALENIGVRDQGPDTSLRNCWTCPDPKRKDRIFVSCLPGDEHPYRYAVGRQKYVLGCQEWNRRGSLICQSLVSPCKCVPRDAMCAEMGPLFSVVLWSYTIVASPVRH